MYIYQIHSNWWRNFLVTQNWWWKKKEKKSAPRLEGKRKKKKKCLWFYHTIFKVLTTQILYPKCSRMHHFASFWKKKSAPPPLLVSRGLACMIQKRGRVQCRLVKKCSEIVCRYLIWSGQSDFSSEKRLQIQKYSICQCVLLVCNQTYKSKIAIFSLATK